MILLKDSNTYDSQIQEILIRTVNELENKAAIQPDLLKLSGTLFEKEVCEMLNHVSVNSDFHNRFEQSSAHAFPDIFAKILENNWFGIEVKTSQSDWRCFGNSIFESVKIPNLDDRIYVFFGKFSKTDLQCRWAEYASCVDNINITHSPRYQINMDIIDNPENSVFAKMDTTYLAFSTADASQRMEFVRKYKRAGLGPNAALWWLPDSDEPTEEEEKKLVIKLFTQLTANEQQEIRNAAIAYFPEIFSNAQSKYSRIPTWLASQYGVVMGNIRDLFSAGGQKSISYNSKNYKMPKVSYHLANGIIQIKHIITSTEVSDLEAQWGISGKNLLSNQDKLNCWLNQVAGNLSKHNTVPLTFPVRDWLTSLINN